ncbi:MAG: HAD-IA family hydrolase [Actinomycetota bacterium]
MADTVAFDVIGTLLSLDRARAALASVGAPVDTLAVWFASSLRDYFAISHSGDYVPLAQVLRADLTRALKEVGIEPSEGVLGEVMGAMSELEATPSAAEAFERLAGAGFEIVTLTNGSAEFTASALDRVGLRDHVAHILSCDEIRVGKPHRSVYEMARNVSNGDVWMVAGHAWDIAGAARAGLRTAFVGGAEDYPDIFDAPEIVAPDLTEAAAAIVAAHR